MKTTTISLPPTLELKLDLTDEQFWQLCHDNSDLKFERTATGELIIMSPTGSTTGERNADLIYQLKAWSRQNNLGKVFDSNTGFTLPNGADRSPDASWVQQERWDALTPVEQERFAPICPDFVVELMSPSDSLEKTRAKMREYMENGARLGWLINRKQRKTEIYRPHQAVEILNNPDTMSGEDVLPGFVLDLSTIW
ncbi:MAG: Uma2 family endonuclease [Moorea sp. SIO1F2]|uniref:Uma2 family endonuclease n=1 Tax=unclassified Moorena TaxID=2683338 RepID=UPI0013B9CD77|nr:MULTISPECIES: Uma2 family endonuclease [unclassified Moorena]NEO07123.1 Uma2 family endonuclease [Moorena sp. SIO3I8]NEP28882.1 Uma2 family endonuclease [Moorena sp. SIO3I6]NET85307.1 Uma2 family endonuclease [Moorena sp. SIO1F2]